MRSVRALLKSGRRRATQGAVTAGIVGLGVIVPDAWSSEVRINEFLASNSAEVPTGPGELVDEDGDASDWIEVRNASGVAVELAGWGLTDDPLNPMRWTFPSVVLGGGEYLIVFASGKDRATAGSELHTDFRIAREAGGYLALSRPIVGGEAGAVEIVSVHDGYPEQEADVSYGVFDTGAEPVIGYFLQPTPGGANAQAPVSGFVADTKFDIGRGIHEAPIVVRVTSATPGASIIYTTDGTLPSESNGTRVDAAGGASGPEALIDVATTTVLRAMAVKAGHQPTNVDTQTYIFPEKVLRQSGAGFGGVNWGHAGPDWEMDPEIVDHSDPAVRPTEEDLARLPSLSIGIPFGTMWGGGGIYISGEGVERDCSIELIYPDGSATAPAGGQDVQIDGTVQIVGGSSTGRWKSDKLSMRIKFTDGDLSFPVFGPEAISSFDTLVVDARLNNVWHYGGGSGGSGQRDRAQYTRDEYAADLQQVLGGHAPHSLHVHVYIAGVYWGIHTLHERPDDNFAADYLGGDNDDYDVMKHRSSTVVSGTSASYALLHQLADRNLAVQENYQAVVDLLDVDDFIHYMLVNYFIGNTDWAHQNWYASYNRVDPSGRWRFHSWDAEHSMESLTHNVVTKNDAGGPTNLQNDLMRNPDYAMRFVDLAYRAFFRGGPLSPTRAAAIYEDRARPIEEAIRIESARWGDNQRSAPYTRLDWLSNRADLLGTYFPQRTGIVVNQLRARGWYPSVDPPQFNLEGGRVDSGFELTMAAAAGGTIHYTIDGSDPRAPADSAAEAVILVPEDATKRVLMPADGSLDTVWMDPGFDDAGWAVGTMGAGYENSAAGGYVPLLDSAFDFTGQVSSTAQETIYVRMPFSVTDAGGISSLTLRVRYDDGFVAWLNGTEVRRVNAPATVAWNSSATSSHSDTEAVQFLSFDISALRGLLREGENVLAVQGLDSGPSGSDFLIWAALEGSRGGGSPGGPSSTSSIYAGPVTLTESRTVKARVLDGAVWSPLVESEFIVDAEPADASRVVVSEIHYRPASPSAEEIAAGHLDRSAFEFLELHNIGSTAVDFTGVVFDAGIDFDFANADFRHLPAGGFLLLVSNRAAFEARYGPGLPVAGDFASGTQLSNTGEAIALSNATLPVDQRTIRSFVFDDEPPWPVEPDGLGYSLVLAAPGTNPDHALPSSWRASSEVGGSPGGPEPGGPAAGIEDWMNAHGLLGLDILDDPNGDGAPLLVDYALTGVPGTGAAFHPAVQSVDPGAGGFTLTFARNAGASDVEIAFEDSGDLVVWTPLVGSETGVEPGAGETEVVTMQFGPGSDGPTGVRFVRMIVRLTP